MVSVKYEVNIKNACRFERIDYSGFWRGYRRGLARRQHGEEHGTDAEHKAWMEKAESHENKSSFCHGLGYRAGFAGKEAAKLYDTRKAIIGK
jgi:hypothetical protein